MRVIKKWTFRMLAAVGALWVLLTVLPVASWATRRLSGPMDRAEGDVLIVPGGASGQWGVIGLSTYWRSSYAVSAWHSGRFQAVVVSGSEGTGEAMKRFLVCHGIPAASVFVEHRASSTRENAMFSAPFIAKLPGRKVLLTSDYHMYRAWRTFRRAGIEVTPYPVPDIGKRANDWTERVPLTIEVALEAAKIVVYQVRGWI